MISVKKNLTLALAALLLGLSFGSMSAQVQSFAYVANRNSDDVSVIATGNNTVVTTVAVGAVPQDVAITPDGAFAYVPNQGSDDVSVIATASNTVVATVAVGLTPKGVAITPDGAFAYVTNQDSEDVSVIATASNTVVATVAVGTLPKGIAITPDGTFAYVTNQGSDDVSVIATASNTVIATVDVGDDPRGVAITPDGTFAYVTNSASDDVSVIATASNAVVATVAVGILPKGIDITSDGAVAYVVNQLSNDVSVIDIASNTVVATVAVGNIPRGVAITGDDAYAYVTNVGANNVSVIATASNAVVSTVAVGLAPRAVAFTPNQVEITVSTSIPAPIIVPAGGITFDMVITVDNNSGFTLNAQLWNTVTLLDLNGEEIGPVGGLGVITISVADGEQFSTTISNFTIPGGVAAGNYLFNWKVGRFPNIELNRDNFKFSKAGGPTLAKTGDLGWGLSPAIAASVPETFSLDQNYPNPFNPETQIRFQLAEESHLVLRIFNTLGQQVRTLVDGPYTAGYHTVRWDSKDEHGNAVSSGTYLYQLQTDSFSQTRKMTLLR